MCATIRERAARRAERLLEPHPRGDGGAGGCVVASLIGLCAVATPAPATVIRERTVPVSLPAAGVADGSSAEPAVSASGRVVAFASTAANLGPRDANGAVRDVYAASVPGRVARLVIGRRRRRRGGRAVGRPALSADGDFVAFTSSASNLVFGDSNGVDDVFVREDPGAVRRVSIATDGGQANGPSGQPAISGDGRYVVFTSAATNLVPGGGGPGTQVYLRDLVAQTTARISDARGGRHRRRPRERARDQRRRRRDQLRLGGDEPRRGRHERRARRLRLDGGEARDRARQRLDARRAAGRGRRRAVRPGLRAQRRRQLRRLRLRRREPRPGDANERTDVFLRDRLRKVTSLVSENNAGFQGNNDSFAPSISADGGYVAFESFATNLAAGGGPRENVFVRDLVLELTSVVNVRSDGASPGAEQVKQLLQRPGISGDGRIVAFTSTARRLTGDASGRSAVLARRMSAPHGRVARPPPRTTTLLRPFVALAADDARATRFSCRVDGGPAFTCRPGTRRLPRQRPGPHVLEARAGGPGMLFDPFAVRARFTVRG